MPAVREYNETAAKNAPGKHYRKGKGSHGTLFVGRKRTTVKRGELSKSLLHTMLKELGIERGKF